MPHSPAISRFQNTSSSVANGVTTPRPVTTTLRSCQLLAINQTGQLKLHPAETAPKLCPSQLLLLVLDVLDDVADALELLGLLVGDFIPKFFLQRHYQFDRIQRIRAQIFDEFGFR